MPLSKSRKAGNKSQRKKDWGACAKGRGDFDSGSINQQVFTIHFCCGKPCRYTEI